MNVKKFLEGDCTESINGEKSVLNKEWWYITTLVEITKNLEPYDISLSSLDLGVRPFEMDSVLHFVQHMIDTEKASLEYPVIVAPAGWIMNGWHRVIKAIMLGKDTIKAVRILKLPEPDGKE